MLRNWAARPPAPLAPVAASEFWTLMMTRVSMVLALVPVVAALAYVVALLAWRRVWGSVGSSRWLFFSVGEAAF
jgi:hypothetical protein